MVVVIVRSTKVQANFSTLIVVSVVAKNVNRSFAI